MLESRGCGSMSGKSQVSPLGVVSQARTQALTACESLAENETGESSEKRKFVNKTDGYAAGSCVPKLSRRVSDISPTVARARTASIRSSTIPDSRVANDRSLSAPALNASRER